MNKYALQYTWFEGEEGKCIVISELEKDEFEKIVLNILESYRGKEIHLPDVYYELLTMLEEVHGCSIAIDCGPVYHLEDNFMNARNGQIPVRLQKFKGERVYIGKP